MSAPKFLGIPLELREDIYTIYLTCPDARPLTTNRERRIHEDTRSWKKWRFDNQLLDKRDDEFLEHCNYYPNPSINPAKPSYSSLPLLLCNRQVNAEVSSTIAYLTSINKDIMRYELDCEFVDEIKVFPTWRYIPPTQPKPGVPIPCVHVTFRFSGQRPNPEVDGIREAWTHGCGGPSGMIRGLQALLNRFLKWGPDFLNLPATLSAPTVSSITPVEVPVQVEVKQYQSRTSKMRASFGRFFKQQSISVAPTAGTVSASLNATTSTAVTPLGKNGVPAPRPHILNIHIENLVLNFVTPPIPPEELHNRDNDGEMIHPKTVASHVAYYLDILFRGVYSDSIKDKEFILSRVGRIHLQCDGEEHTTYDLESMN